MESRRNASRHRADVGSSVAADLRLIPHTAETDADVIFIQARATLLAIEVLPVPGGPARQRIALAFLRQVRTARNSRILSFTFERP